jgi:hypothetical protein
MGFVSQAAITGFYLSPIFGREAQDDLIKAQ